MGMNNSMLALTCKFSMPIQPSRLELVLHGYASADGATAPKLQHDWQEDEFVEGMMKLYQLWQRRSAYFVLTLLASIPVATCLVDLAMSELEIRKTTQDETLASTASENLFRLPVASECRSADVYKAQPTQLMLWRGLSIALASLLVPCWLLPAWHARAELRASRITNGTANTVERAQALQNFTDPHQLDTEAQKAFFHELDTNGDGVISKEEFQGICRGLPVRGQRCRCVGSLDRQVDKSERSASALREGRGGGGGEFF